MSTKALLPLFAVLALPTLAQVWSSPIMERADVNFSSDARASLVHSAEVQQRNLCRNDSACAKNFERVAGVALESYIKNTQELYPEKKQFTKQDLTGLNLSMPNYGRLVMSSTPPEATVFLLETKSEEGTTTLRKAYPVGRYTFRLVKTGCQDTLIEATVEKDKLTEREVPLRNCS